MNTRLLLFLFIVILLASFSLPTSGQSGRGSQRKSTKEPAAPVKPKRTISIPEHSPTRQKGNRDETIRIDTDLVSLVTSVTVPMGAGSGELRREDFEVLEDGRPQEIASFARDQDTPLRLVMLFDSSTSVAPRINFQRQAAARFFQRVIRPQDEGALFSVSTDVELLQGLTNRVSLLTDATRQLRAEGATSLYDGIFLAADYLKLYPGRHIIVIVSDGGDTTSAKDLLAALAQSQLANAVIFAVFSGNPYPSENLRDLAAERALLTLAQETGGEVYFPFSNLNVAKKKQDQEATNTLDEAFVALADRLHTQYTIGFYSNNETRDGAFRKLTVRIKKTGYVAHARSGYYAPKN